MRASGYRTVLLLNRTYQHQHSVSISKTYTQLLKRQKLRNESAYYYMVHYLHINRYPEADRQRLVLDDFTGGLAGSKSNGTVRRMGSHVPVLCSFAT